MHSVTSRGSQPMFAGRYMPWQRAPLIRHHRTRTMYEGQHHEHVTIKPYLLRHRETYGPFLRGSLCRMSLLTCCRRALRRLSRSFWPPRSARMPTTQTYGRRHTKLSTQCSSIPQPIATSASSRRQWSSSLASHQPCKLAQHRCVNEQTLFVKAVHFCERALCIVAAKPA